MDRQSPDIPQQAVPEIRHVADPFDAAVSQAFRFVGKRIYHHPAILLSPVMQKLLRAIHAVVLDHHDMILVEERAQFLYSRLIAKDGLLTVSCQKANDDRAI